MDSRIEPNENKQELNNIKSKVDLINLKSYYFLKNLFDIIKKNKSLELLNIIK